MRAGLTDALFKEAYDQSVLSLTSFKSQKELMMNDTPSRRWIHPNARARLALGVVTMLVSAIAILVAWVVSPA